MTRGELEQKLERRRRELEESRAALARDDGSRAYVLAGLLLDDAIAVAGLARSLERPEGEVHDALRAAAAAGLRLLELTGRYASRVEDVATGEQHERVDTSLSTPLTYVQALSAALAAGDDGLTRALALVPERLYAASERMSSEAPILYARALAAAARGDDGAAADAHDAAQAGAGDPYWTAHAEALELALAGDGGSAETRARSGLDPEGQVPQQLPELLLLGILALAARRAP